MATFKKFRIEVSAVKVVEVTLSELDLLPGEDSVEEGAERLAKETAFHNSYPDMVTLIQDWDVDIDNLATV